MHQMQYLRCDRLTLFRIIKNDLREDVRRPWLFWVVLASCDSLVVQVNILRFDLLCHFSPFLQTSELTQWLFGTAVAALAIWLVLLVQRKFFQPQTKKEPPGPWALPLVGTLGISNTASLFRKSVEWAKLYGPIFR